MTPTVWSLFFANDSVSHDIERKILESKTMESLRRELRSVVDCSFPHSADKALGDALQSALDVPVLNVLVRAWRTHPELPSSIRQSSGEKTTVLFGLGEHEVTSTHHPRIDVLGPSDMLGSFEFEVRLQLMVQCATLQIDESGRVVRATIGACEGSGSLLLGSRELASFDGVDISFPEDVSVDLNIFDDPQHGHLNGSRHHERSTGFAGRLLKRH